MELGATAKGRKAVRNNLDDLVDLEKLRAFQDKIYKMARQEFGTDDEGKINKVSIICVDRSRYWPMHWFPVPYDHKAKTEEDLETILRALLTNVSIAADEMRIHLDIERYRKQRKAADRESEKTPQ